MVEVRTLTSGQDTRTLKETAILRVSPQNAYTAAKGGAINLTRSLCVAYAKDGIRANTVAPGFVATPMVESVLSIFDDPKLAKSTTPMARPATAEEIAYARLFFACDESSYCNGSVLVVDGGQIARQ
jgi:NAD(P)-dependent dehydrogenase (short-subunit alcohol dehydrogenase family)